MVAVQLADGERVKGRVGKVEANALTIKLKKSSNPAVYPKRKIQIPREVVYRIEARSSIRARPAREAGRIGLTGAVFVGALFGSVYALVGKASESEPNDAQFGGSVAIATGAAVLTYRALRPKGVTLIEILPDSPSERRPKPTDKEQSAGPTAWGVALAASLIEESSAERLRRQSRRAVMRQDLPLDLSSLPMHGHRPGID